MRTDAAVVDRAGAAETLDSLRKNIASLYVVQFATYLIPLTTLPWLTHVLGVEGFGRLGFSSAIINYFIILADYGFNLSATRQIALNRNDRLACSATFWTTMTAKAALAIAGLFVLLSLTFIVERLTPERLFLAIGYLAVLGNLLTPSWYFQGTERLSRLSLITIAVRLLAVPTTFMCVTSPDDLPIAMAIGACTPVAIGAVCCTQLIRERAVGFVMPTRATLFAAMREGWSLFLSTASTTLYTAANPIILGFVAGNVAVGHYNAAERLLSAVRGLIGPVSQSVYPRITRLMKDSQNEAFALVRKLLRLQGAATFALSALLFVSAPTLITLLYGAAFAESVHVLRWLSLLPFVIGLSNVFGIQTMLPLGMSYAFSRILIGAGLVHLLTLLYLTHLHGAIGAAMAVLLTEAAVAIAMAGTLWRRGVPIFTGTIALGTRL